MALAGPQAPSVPTLSLPPPAYLALTTDSESTLGTDTPSEVQGYSSPPGLSRQPGFSSPRHPPSPSSRVESSRPAARLTPTSEYSYVANEGQLKEFTYELSRKGRQFVVLTLCADAGLSRQTATFVDGQPVMGKLILHFERPDTIGGVHLTVSRYFLVVIRSDPQLPLVYIGPGSLDLWYKQNGTSLFSKCRQNVMDTSHG